MSDQVTVSRDIAAAPETLWAMVSDVTRMGEWSPENVGGEWLDGATGPQPGAKFRGTNSHGKKTWKTVATVTDCVPGKEFAFMIKAGGMSIAEWRYQFEPAAGGCRVTETWTDHRGGVVKMLGRVISGVADRATHNRAGWSKPSNGWRRRPRPKPRNS